MPKSKRVKAYSFTMTKPKGRESKDNVINKVRECIGVYKRCFVFEIQRMDSPMIQSFRKDWVGSRIILGKKKVLAVALGRTAEEEISENIHQIVPMISSGEMTGLLFTNAPEQKVLEYCQQYKGEAFAVKGDIATETFSLPPGKLPFLHSEESYLRNELLMPTQLTRGEVHLIKPLLVCSQGEPLTAQSAKILKKFDKKMSSFGIIPKCCYQQGDVKVYQS